MKTPVSAVLVAVALTAAALPLQAQSGLVSGVVVDVQTSDGEPAGNVPIRLAGSAGATTVASTGASGSATVPYSSSALGGRRVVVVGVTVAGGQNIALVPEGETLQECDDPSSEQNSCEELGVLVWGQTQQLSLRFSTGYADAGSPGTSPAREPDWKLAQQRRFMAGPTVQRSRELGAFGFGAELNARLAPAFSGGSWLLSGGLSRYGLLNSSVWAYEIQGGLQVPVGATVALRGMGGMVFDRHHGQYSSGTERGFTLSTGVVYTLPLSGYRFSIVGEVGLTDRRDTRDIGFGLGLLSSW